MNFISVEQVSIRSGLRVEVCRELLEKGWTFVTEDDTPAKWVWVSPSAGLPEIVMHNEPMCNNRCGNYSPHKHGLSCFKACATCHGVCHPNCPAYKEK